MRIKLISCEIFYREVCATVARSVNQVDVRFLPKGLHDIGAAGMSERLAGELADVDESKYDAILLGYGLCNNGVVGLTASSIPIVLPRAHDCITLFLGDKARYHEYFHANPGTYFATTGWLERGEDEQLHQLSVQHDTGMDMSYDELVAKYGEDNARFLYEQLGDRTRHYRQITFIEMGIEPDDRFEREASGEAAKRGWKFDKVPGDLSLMQRFVDGEWDETEFLIVAPGRTIRAVFDDSIVAIEELKE